MKATKLIGIGAAAVTVGWIATKLLSHTWTFLGWLFTPVGWALDLVRLVLTPVGWAVGWLPGWAAHWFMLLMFTLGIGLIAGRAAVLAIRAGDRQLRRRRHLATQDRIALLERTVLTKPKPEPHIPEQ